MSTTQDQKRLAALRGRARVLVETIELSVELPEADDLDTLQLRIELFESLEAPKHFSARIWRIEFYRLQSTFPQLSSGAPSHTPSDELIMKEFEGFESPLETPVAFADRVAARDHVLEQLARWLGDMGLDESLDVSVSR